MRIPINLASEPFRKDRPIFVASVAVSVLLCGLLAVLISLSMAERNRAAQSRAEMEKVDAELRRLTTQQTQLEAFLRKPENADVLEKSQFINMLLIRKGVSWTKIFQDLETVMPHNVRLVNVRPQLNGPNDLILDMTVAAQSAEPVVSLLNNLQKSPLFGTTTLHSWLPPGQTEPLYRYRVSVNYAQKL
jgi:type IV pilus assembly protein PilN